MKRKIYNLYWMLIRARFRQRYNRKNFDMRCIDRLIAQLANKIYKKYENCFDSFNGFKYDVGYFATELYNVGGHTACLINLAKSVIHEKTGALFLSRMGNSIHEAPDAIKELTDIMDVHGITFCSHDFVSAVIDLYNKIIVNCPRVAITYTHMDDLLFAAVAHLVKKNTGMKIIFFDHASHFPTVGMGNADMILHGMETTRQIAITKRHIRVPCRIVGLQSVKRGETKIYTRQQIAAERRKIGIPMNAPLVVSGGVSYKFFDNNTSEFFETACDMLVRNKKLYIMVITDLDESQQEIISNIFADHTDALNRLIIHPRTRNFEILFQCADVFMDSFPISAAMTQIDLMRMRVPTVVKINRKNPLYSFHEYMPTNYPYMFEKASDLANGILYLLDNPDARKKLIADNYDFWEKTYEETIVKNKYLSFIEQVLKNDK